MVDATMPESSAPDSAEPRPPDGVAPRRGTGPACILAVDDEENILASLRRLLKREPYTLLTAGSGEEALRLLDQHDVGVIITDQRMPGMSGIELLRQVRQRRPEIKRIMLSGYSEVRAIVAAINEGAIYKYIAKPWDDDAIKLHIRRALEVYELEAENRRLTREVAEQNRHLRELNERLNELATDEHEGHAVTLDLLEHVDAGMVVIDANDLVVTANAKAWSLLRPAGGELLGTPAREALPAALHGLLGARPGRGAGTSAGRLVTDAARLQWRSKAVDRDGEYQGQLLVLWEEVA